MAQQEINLVCGNNIEIIEQRSDYTLYCTKQDSGEGFVKEYQLWDGVFLGIMDLTLEHIIILKSPWNVLATLFP